MREGTKYIIFTDLDGTLFDRHDYSHREALGGIRILKQRGIPIVFCSAKTRAEQEFYRRELAVRDPFVVENGNAAFVEEDYFDFRYPYDRSLGGYHVLEYGSSYRHVRNALESLRTEAGVEFVGYGDLTAEDVASLTGLSIAEAVRAMDREYEETIVTPLNDDQAETLGDLLRARGMTLSRGGRFLSVSARADKGRAVEALAKLFRREHGSIATVGIGDSWNDAPMLSSVDLPFLVQKEEGIWEDVDVDTVNKVSGVGPQGWSRAIEGLLGRPPAERPPHTG